MKKTGLFLLMGLLLFVGSPYICKAQSYVASHSVVMSWTKSFTFGGISDIPYPIDTDGNGNIFTAGMANYGKSDGSGIFGAVSKFSPDGSLIWTTVEDSSKYPQSATPLRGLVATNDGGVYVAFNFALKTGGYLSRKDANGKESWTLGWKDSASYIGAITSYNDTLIALKTSYTNAQIFFVTPEGKYFRTIDLNMASLNTASAIQVRNGNIFVFSQKFGGTTTNMTGYVLKLDLATGNVIRESDFSDVFLIQGTVDKFGNVFVGMSQVNRQITPFVVKKLDENGNVVWTNRWFTGDSLSEYDYICSMAVDNNRLAMVGSAQRDTYNHTVSNWYACAVIFNATTGDSVWSWYGSFQPIAGNLDGNNLNGAVFSGSHLEMVGNFFSHSTGKNTCYLVDYSVISDGVEKTGNEVPEGFSLSQNYPNPFNPSTTIEFKVAKRSFVSLRVYNLLGQEVSVLVNEEKSPGTYKADWNGLNLPSGVYVYRMQTDNAFTSVKKMMLVK